MAAAGAQPGCLSSVARSKDLLLRRRQAHLSVTQAKCRQLISNPDPSYSLTNRLPFPAKRTAINPSASAPDFAQVQAPAVLPTHVPVGC